MTASTLFGEELRVINVGAELFADALREQGTSVTQLDWTPPAGGDTRAIHVLDVLESTRDESGTSIREKIEAANRQAAEVLTNAQPVLVDVVKARDFLPGMKDNLILHAGPPITPDHLTGVMKTSVCGAAVHEGLAPDMETAWKMVLAGEIELAPAQDFPCSNSAVSLTTASTPLMIARDPVTGRSAGCCLLDPSEGDTLRWGRYTPAVEQQLRWYDNEIAPALREVLVTMGGLNIRPVIAKALAMGDELHVRQNAATALIFQEFGRVLPDIDIDEAARKRVIKFFASHERFSLHIFMAGIRAVLDAISDIPYCSLVTAMGGNGYEIGLKFSGTGREWFTAPAPKLVGHVLNPQWTDDDVLPYLGDSCLLEAYGLGGLAAAAGAEFVFLTGGDFRSAVRRTEEAREFSAGEHTWIAIPALDFRGPPVGIDMVKVVDTGILPWSHGGSGHRNGGQAGVGATTIPMECFTGGLDSLARRLGLS